MAESGFFLPVFIFFAIVISSLGWQILIKGVGTVDNFWAFGLMISTVFMLTGSAVTFYPFADSTFFISVLIFMNLSTLYIYSFPKSIWPNFIWIIFMTVASTLSLVIFFSVQDRIYFGYYSIPVFFLSINIPVIIRKIKYLEPTRVVPILIHVSFVTLLSVLFPIAAGVSAMNYHPMFFLVLLTVTVPVTLVLFGISSYLNVNTGSGISSINFPLILFISAPVTMLLKNMFSLRVVMLNYIGSVNFTFAALFLLFFFVNAAGVFVSVFSSSVEGFINRSRHFYQKYLNKYKLEMEKTTDSSDLFNLFHNSVSLWFKEIRSMKYIFFTDEFSAGKDVTLYEDYPFSDINADRKFLQDPYFVKNSVDFPDEMVVFSAKYKGNVFMPVVYRNELVGFIVIETRKFSHSAVLCIHGLIEMTMNRFEKLSLFTSVLEAEKKIETLKHFQETGKMVSIIAHELRSPLSSIMFNMEVIKESVFKMKNPDPEYLEISLKEIKRLNETVEKMLNYGRTIKLTPEEGDFSTFFDEVGRLFPSLPGQIKFVETTNREKFNFDWDMLKSVMINLISNSMQAIEESGKKGTVTVKCLKRRNKIIIEISDTGPGISPLIRSSIFEPFFTTRKEGNGLGLATSEKIIKLSGGTIVLKETSEKGTVFQITLPVE